MKTRAPLTPNIPKPIPINTLKNGIDSFANEDEFIK